MALRGQGTARLFLPDGYVERPQPEYFLDDTHETTCVTWQPDVYRVAADFGSRLGASTIIDAGCGDGAKLLADCAGFATIGIDYGPNLESCLRRAPGRIWRELDFEGPDPLPVTLQELRNAVIVCADVIEHLVNPVPLLARLRDSLSSASVILLSTPERALTWGDDHLGPPPNVSHVREWSLAELGRLLRNQGFDRGVLGLTRSNDATRDERTSLAVLPGPRAARALRIKGWSESLTPVESPRRAGRLSALLRGLL